MTTTLTSEDVDRRIADAFAAYEARLREAEAIATQEVGERWAESEAEYKAQRAALDAKHEAAEVERKAESEAWRVSLRKGTRRLHAFYGVGGLLYLATIIITNLHLYR